MKKGAKTKVIHEEENLGFVKSNIYLTKKRKSPFKKFDKETTWADVIPMVFLVMVFIVFGLGTIVVVTEEMDEIIPHYHNTIDLGVVRSYVEPFRLGIKSDAETGYHEDTMSMNQKIDNTEDFMEDNYNKKTHEYKVQATKMRHKKIKTKIFNEFRLTVRAGNSAYLVAFDVKSKVVYDVGDSKNLQYPPSNATEEGCLGVDLRFKKGWYRIIARDNCRILHDVLLKWQYSSRSFVTKHIKGYKDKPTGTRKSAISFHAENPVHWELIDIDKAGGIIQKQTLLDVTYKYHETNNCITLYGELYSGTVISVNAKSACHMTKLAVDYSHDKSRSYALQGVIGEEEHFYENPFIHNLGGTMLVPGYELHFKKAVEHDHDMVTLNMDRSEFGVVKITYEHHNDDFPDMCLKLHLVDSMNQKYIFYLRDYCDLLVHEMALSPYLLVKNAKEVYV